MSRDINKSFQSEIDKAAFIKQKIEESAGSSSSGGSSGGIGSTQAIRDVSNFAVDLPDALYVDSVEAGLSIAYLQQIWDNDYSDHDTSVIIYRFRVLW